MQWIAFSVYSHLGQINFWKEKCQMAFTVFFAKLYPEAITRGFELDIAHVSSPTGGLSGAEKIVDHHARSRFPQLQITAVMQNEMPMPTPKNAAVRPPL